jgi:O-antigen ligase
MAQGLNLDERAWKSQMPERGTSAPRVRGRIPRLRGLQLIVLILFLSSFVEGFFPEIVASRDWEMVQRSPADPANLTRIGFIGLAAFMSFIAYLRRNRLTVYFHGPLRWMFLYATVAVISAGYASLPLVSAGKAAEVIADVACFLVLASVLSADDFLHSWNMLWSVVSLLLVSVWVSALLFPSIGFVVEFGPLFPLLQGAYPMVTPNTLGQFGASLAIVALCRFLGTSSRLHSQRRMLWGGICLLGLATLAASQARTSMVALALAVPACLYLYRRLRLVTLLGWAAIALTIGAFGNALMNASGMSEILSQYVRRGQSPELIYSLSGRLDYWQFAWDLFSASPLLGHGFYTAHRIDLNAISGRFRISTVDNTYLEVLLGIGLIGLFPLVMAIVVLVRRIIRVLKLLPAGGHFRGAQIEMIGFLIIALVRSLTGPTFQVHGANLVLLLVIMAFIQSIYAGRLGRSKSYPIMTAAA